MSLTAVYIDNETDDARRCQTCISSDSHLIEAELKLKLKIQKAKIKLIQNKIMKKLKGKGHFIPNGKMNFLGWTLILGKNVMICVPCREYEKAGRFVEGTDNFRIDAVKSHNDSSSHEINVRNYQIKQQQNKSASTGAKSIFTTYTGEIDNRSQDPV